MSEKGEKNLLSKTLYNLASSKNNSHKCLDSEAAQQQQGTFGTSWKQEQERHQGGRNSDYEGSTWEHVTKGKDSFQVDLWNQGESQDAI